VRNGSVRTRPRAPGLPASTEPPPFLTAAFPGAMRTSSSKRTTTCAGAAASTAPSRGRVCSSFACAKATAGAASAPASTGIRRRDRLIASSFVIFRQFVDDGLGCASYLIGDENEGIAVVVDPAYAI